MTASAASQDTGPPSAVDELTTMPLARGTPLEQHCAKTKQTCSQLLQQAELERVTAANCPEDHHALLMTAKDAHAAAMEASSLVVFGRGGKAKYIDPDTRAALLLGLFLGTEQRAVRKHVTAVVKAYKASNEVVAKCIASWTHRQHCYHWHCPVTPLHL